MSKRRYIGENVSILNKAKVLRFLDEEQKNYPTKLSNKEAHEKVAKYIVEEKIGEKIGESTLRRWRTQKARIITQAEHEEKRAAKNKQGKNKHCITDEMRLFENELHRILTEVFQVKNITARVFRKEAKKLRKSREWRIPKRIKFSRGYREGFFGRYNWKWKKCVGSKKVVPQKVIDQADEEMKLILTGYTSSEIGNFDESGCLLNDAGRYSMQLPGVTAARKLHFLNEKARLTMAKFKNFFFNFFCVKVKFKLF